MQTTTALLHQDLISVRYLIPGNAGPLSTGAEYLTYTSAYSISYP